MRLTPRGWRVLTATVWLAALAFGWFSIPLGIWWTGDIR